MAGGLRSASRVALRLQSRTVQDFTCCLSDGLHEFGRLKHDRAAAPAQHPALDLAQTGELEPQFHTAVLQLAQLLRWMPALLPDVIRRIGIEADHHREVSLPGVNTK